MRAEGFPSGVAVASVIASGIGSFATTASVNQQTFETVPIPTELREKLAPYNANEDHK